MEEDIKILENGLKAIKKNRRGNQEIRFEVNSNYYKALENLIVRYKDLEKLAEGIEKIRDITIPAKTDFIIVMRENYLPYIKNDFIPKSKVKEKIEWLKEISDNGMNAVRFASTHEDEIERKERQKCISRMIEILQELLED